MKRFLPLFLLLAGIASAQTTAIQPKVCVKVSNCVLYDEAGNTVWSDVQPGYADFLLYGISPNQQTFTDQVEVTSPVDPNPADNNPIIWAVAFQAPDGKIYTEILKGYSYYSRGGGGRGGGGAGTRYAVTSGSITVTN